MMEADVRIGRAQEKRRTRWSVSTPARGDEEVGGVRVRLGTDNAATARDLRKSRAARLRREASSVIDADGETVSPPEVPDDDTLRLTVPTMARAKELPVGTGPADDEATLAESALHVEGTGFPWEEGANFYIAGQRLGYEGKASHLVFYDLDVLQNGDEFILTDADGTRYTYRVFRGFVVGPGAYHATEAVPGRSLVSLQTCTLPDYSESSSCTTSPRTSLPEGIRVGDRRVA